ncbi:MAG: abortive infection family protein [Chitinophagales bacterium]
MSDLKYAEKSLLEELFGMKSGYVLDFTDRTFQEFVLDATGIDILTQQYSYQSNSKANRLRAFWKREPNYLVGKLMKALLDYWLDKANAGIYDANAEENLYKSCFRIVERLQNDSIVDNLDALKPNIEERDFSLLAKSIKESVEKNEPEIAIDRLHTFMMKYVRQLCKTHNLSIEKDEALHSLFGKYVKHLKNNNLIESEMTEKILKSSISVFDSFNDVRNNKSLAHDNPTLNYQESVLIINNISNVVRFIEAIEAKRMVTKGMAMESNGFEDLPF